MQDATSAITKGQEQGVKLRAQQGRQLNAKIVTKVLGKLGALEATNEYKTIQFKAQKPHHNLQLVCYIEAEEETDKNQLIKMKVFKLTNRHATKCLRIRQETRELTRNGKTTEVTLKYIASQELHLEKKKMQVWKQMIMQKVAHELQIIKKLAKVYKERFEEEIEVIKE